jgi:hypothetical protein
LIGSFRSSAQSQEIIYEDRIDADVSVFCLRDLAQFPAQLGASVQRAQSGRRLKY